MARNMSGVYSLPAGSIVTDGTTIEISQHNTPLQDLATDANTARPVVAGGTGATTASGARTNLGLGTIATQAASSVDIDGGTIDGTVIGGNSAAAGTFTTLSASGDVNFDSNTLFVDASANVVGVGTNTPQTNFEVYRTGGAYPALFRTDQANSNITFGSTGSSNNFYQGIGTGDGTDMRIFAGNTARMTVTSAGDVGIGLTNPTTMLTVHESDNSAVAALRNTNFTYTNTVTALQAVRGGNSVYNFLTATSAITTTPDTEFKVRGDGEVTAEGSFTGGGADYAEYFEWSDGNPNAEDRVGYSVVLDGEKIRFAQNGEEPIGVISGNPSVVGDGDIDRWKQKYLRDDFGRYIMEDYDVLVWTEGDEEHTYDADNVPDDVVVTDDAQTVVQQRRKLNPDYNPGMEYISRENRPEWDTVGLMGKLRVRKGQPTGERWIKMRDVSADVEEWLVR